MKIYIFYLRYTKLNWKNKRISITSVTSFKLSSYSEESREKMKMTYHP